MTTHPLSKWLDHTERVIKIEEDEFKEVFQSVDNEGNLLGNFITIHKPTGARITSMYVPRYIEELYKKHGFKKPT